VECLLPPQADVERDPWLIRHMSSNAAYAKVFVYTRDGGAAFPVNVVCIQVDLSVTSIPANAFEDRKKLTKVELCESLI